MKHIAEQFEFGFADLTKINRMIFTIIYKNDAKIREQVIEMVKQAILTGNDLTKAQIHCPLFRTSIFWPNIQSLASLPLNYQCEELEYKDEKFEVLRKLSVDVEAKVS